MATEGQLEPVSQGSAHEQPGDPRSGKPGHVPEAEQLEMLLPPGIGAGAGMREAAIARIPVELDVAIPIRKFRVRNLLALAAGQVIATQWLEGEDLPLAGRGAQLAWTEFEVIDQKLAVRITRLA